MTKILDQRTKVKTGEQENFLDQRTRGLKVKDKRTVEQKHLKVLLIKFSRLKAVINQCIVLTLQPPLVLMFSCL